VHPLAGRQLLAALLVALLALPMGRALAQHPAADSPLLSRLDPASRHQLETLFDSAARLGFAPDFLISKTLEGIQKGVNPRRIVEVVRRNLAAMRDARSTLGPETTKDELETAAGALYAGVSTRDLARLRDSRKGKPIILPLIVLADFVSKGVPTTDASSAIVQLSQRGAVDSDFRGLWLRVNQDIVSGIPPAAALDRWTREFPGRAPGARLPSGSPTGPPSPAPRPPETPSSPSP
jgi:hypothetical protein